jgi:hypothetical protein
MAKRKSEKGMHTSSKSDLATSSQLPSRTQGLLGLNEGFDWRDARQPDWVRSCPSAPLVVMSTKIACLVSKGYLNALLCF